MADNDGETHYLTPYLTSFLPTVGIDSETYIPYITGYSKDNDENGNGDNDDDLEALDELMELLQASSESHSDDESVWEELRGEILSRGKVHREEVRLQKEAKMQILRQKEDEKRLQEIELAKQTEEVANQKKIEQQTKQKLGSLDDMDPVKRALMERFAYDDSEMYDDNGDLIVDGGTSANDAKGKGGDETEESNRSIAQKSNKEKAQELRKAQVQTKTEERVKTKNAKLEKINKKEERRKRAQKGERRR